MGLDPIATAYIAMWIIELWRGGAPPVIPPLPEIEFAAFALMQSFVMAGGRQHVQ